MWPIRLLSMDQFHSPFRLTFPPPLNPPALPHVLSWSYWQGSSVWLYIQEKLLGALKPVSPHGSKGLSECYKFISNHFEKVASFLFHLALFPHSLFFFFLLLNHWFDSCVLVVAAVLFFCSTSLWFVKMGQSYCGDVGCFHCYYCSVFDVSVDHLHNWPFSRQTFWHTAGKAQTLQTS